MPEREFLQMYRSERDGEKWERLLAVSHLVYKKATISYVAEMLHRRRSTVKSWQKRFMENGIDGLDYKLRSDQPPDTNHKITEYAAKKM